MDKACRCGGLATEKRINIERIVRGRHITFNHVPALVCPNCGEKYLTAKVVKAMDRLLSEDNKSDNIDFEIGPLGQSVEKLFHTLPQAAALFKDQPNGYPSFADLFSVREIITEWKRSQAAS